MWAVLTKHWFLTALAICFVAGYFGADWLRPGLESSWIRNGVMFGVMWAMGVTLKAKSVRQSLVRPGAVFMAIGLNMLFVPVLALPSQYWLSDSLFGGMFVASIVPCTLAGASVWTRKAGGDDSVAMMTTVVTNLACILVVPLGVWFVLSEQVQIQASAQIGKLALLVVVPLLLAQLMRGLGFQSWADRHKPTLAVCAQFGILVMVTLGAAASGLAVASTELGDQPTVGQIQRLSSVGVVLLTTLGIHLAALTVGVILARVSGMDSRRQIAVGFSGSQKTLMVGLQTSIDCGVSVVPMLIYHVGQLAIDTWIAQRWKARHGEGT